MIQEVKTASSDTAGKLSLSRQRIWWGVSLGVMGLLSIGLFIMSAVAAIFADYDQGGEMSSQPETTPDALLRLSSISTPALMLASLPPTIAVKKPLATPAGTTANKTGSRLSDTIVLSSLEQFLPETPPLKLRTVSEAFTVEAPADSLVAQSAGVLGVTEPVLQAAAVLNDAPPEAVSPPISANSYALIPLEGVRESRPAEAHGDLNLKLRDPQPIAADLTLVEINEAGLDPDAPKLSSIFKPDFVRAYTVHDWDWSCNCKGKLLHNEHLVLLGLRTMPGEPVFIPRKKQDVYQGKYYALVLYAAEDSLTFVYTRAGSVAYGYTVHYLGLRTDPNLVAQFRQSGGNTLPGLTLNTPVGVATDELIVAIRDNGTFLDVRSRLDWWE